MRSRSPTIAMEPQVVVAVRPICVKARVAAQMLDISQRQLYELTAPRGPIPCVRMGNSIRLFRVADLEKWAKQQAQK